jgi:hypothetical protein
MAVTALCPPTHCARRVALIGPAGFIRCSSGWCSVTRLSAAARSAGSTLTLCRIARSVPARRLCGFSIVFSGWWQPWKRIGSTSVTRFSGGLVGNWSTPGGMPAAWFRPVFGAGPKAKASAQGTRDTVDPVFRGWPERFLFNPFASFSSAFAMPCRQNCEPIFCP